MFINNLRNSVIQSEEIIFILRMWQRGSLLEHNEPNRDVLTLNRDVMNAKCVFS